MMPALKICRVPESTPKLTVRQVAHLEFLGVLREPAKDLRDERRDGFRLPRGRHGTGNKQTVLKRNQRARHSRQRDGLLDDLVRRPVFLVRFLEKFVETLRLPAVRNNGWDVRGWRFNHWRRDRRGLNARGRGLKDRRLFFGFDLLLLLLNFLDFFLLGFNRRLRLWLRQFFAL